MTMDAIIIIAGQSLAIVFLVGKTYGKISKSIEFLMHEVKDLRNLINNHLEKG